MSPKLVKSVIKKDIQQNNHQYCTCNCTGRLPHDSDSTHWCIVDMYGHYPQYRERPLEYKAYIWTLGPAPSNDGAKVCAHGAWKNG
jgi:hypothetical protein